MMKDRTTPLRVSLIAALLLIPTACSRDLPGAGADHGRTVLYRDTWGVAHIYAPTVEAGAYAMGWGQAEDRPAQLLENLKMALGEYASVVGEGGIRVDLQSRAWDHYGIATRRYGELPSDIRAAFEAYVAGINDWYAEHPEDVPEWWGERTVDPAMVVALGRMFLYNWSINEVFGDLQRAGIEPGLVPEERGSNQFAVAPQRSTEGAAILAIDPHLGWFGLSRFWEFRIHAGELAGSGVTLAGTGPGIGLGHTRHLAWAMTTGGPDTADVYQLTLKPDDPNAYLYDGEWRSLTSRRVTLEIRGAEPREYTLYSSHHGPVVASRGDTAWAAKIAYSDQIGCAEAYWELNYADDYRGAIRAVETLTMYPQNIMVADTSGNIFYIRAGRVPVRPEGYDWSRPVDGSTSATEWQGVHPASDLLQVLNPPQGFMQNCNIPPDAMMPSSPFRLADQPSYLFSSLQYGGRLDGWTNQRGARAVELLAADASVTVEEAKAYITDVHPFGAERWVEALRRADERFAAELDDHPHYRPAVDDLLSWDGRLAADSTGGLKYALWRELLESEHGTEDFGIDDDYSVVRGEEPAPLELADEALRALITAFDAAMARLLEFKGSLDVPYGERYRVGRGERSWSLGGGGGFGTTTLRNVGYGPQHEDGTRWGERGQTSTQVVVLSDPPRSWIYLPLGESDRPGSPHYRDQAEKAFSPRRLKPSWWRPAELARHIESRTVLEWHPGGRTGG
jgi:acyl-homoserine lactone acylase PvdQ